MRPYLSTWMACSSLLGPVTIAVWMPRMRGLPRAARRREGRALGEPRELVLADVVVARRSSSVCSPRGVELGDHELAVQAVLRGAVDGERHAAAEADGAALARARRRRRGGAR